MTGEDWLAWCDFSADRDEPPDLDEEEPDSAVPWEYDLDAIVADCLITAEEAAACARAARLGLGGGQPIGLARRGPGQPGSARRAPGEYLSRAAGFAAGMLLDIMPGCNALAGFAAEAAGEDDRYQGACDDEVAGAVAAWDRVEAHAAARKHAAVAEFIRRRAEPGCVLEGPARMPAVWDEFTVTEVAALLGESRGTAEDLLDLAHDLAVKLPGTRAAFRDGTLRAPKVEIIARAAKMLDSAEARRAEAMVLDRAGRLTPGGLRAAIARAVMEVAPEKARKRREQAAKDARVLRWEEDSGNAALTGRELPPAKALAADQRITAWARQLKKAGLEGSMHELRARAYLDLLLDEDSRPASPGAVGAGAGRDGTRTGGTGRRRAGRPASGRFRTGRTRRAEEAAGNRRGAGRVRRAGEPDRPAGHRAGPGRAARGDPRDRAGRPRPGSRPGRRRRPQSEDHVVRDRDRRPRARYRPRLRPAGTQEPPGKGETLQTQSAGRTRSAPRDRHPGAGVLLHGLRPAWPAGRIRDLAAADRRRGAGPDRRVRPDHHQRLRPPVPGQGPRPRGQAPAPVADPARYLHRDGLPKTLDTIRFRTQHPVRGRWQNVFV